MSNKEKGKKRPPQLNKFMHPRNPYKSYPSFKDLATSYPEFRSHCTYDVSGKVYLDFKNTQALKALTTSLLDKDFGLQVHIPDGRLVPTLPLRLNYLLWIEDLLSHGHSKAQNITQTPIIGIDIGTGATCVYPLLGSKKFKWHFIATETDEISFKSAQENVIKNKLESSILLKKSSKLFDVLKEEDSIEFIENVKNRKIDRDVAPQESETNLSLYIKASHSNTNHCKQNGGSDTYLAHFTMCNPPFFSSEAEMEASHNSKKETRSLPTSVSTGSKEEKVTEGGEVAFITKLIEKSLERKKEVRIFTTLIGKKSDVKSVVRLVKEKAQAEGDMVSVVETEFCQGRTMRWGVAWTFDPSVSLSKVVSKKQRMSQKPLVLYIPRSKMSAYTVQSVWTVILSWFKDIKIKPVVFKNKKHYVGAMIRAYKATWLHQRQKKRKKNFLSLHASNNNSESVNECSEKRKSEDKLEEEKSPKKLHLDLEGTDDVRMGTQEDSAIGSSPPASGMECILKCSFHLKLTGTLIRMEMNYQSGTGNKDAMCQLLQYLENRLKNNLASLDGTDK